MLDIEKMLTEGEVMMVVSAAVEAAGRN